MKILAEYNGDRVYLVQIRENGTCDVIKTIYDEKTETDKAILLLVNKKDLKIVDPDFMIDSLQEHLRVLERDANKKKQEELTEREKALLKEISKTNGISPRSTFKKDLPL